MFKGLGNMAHILKNAQKHAQVMQKRIEEVQHELKEKVVDGSAGGGMVTAYVNGNQEVLSVKIDPEVVSKEDVEMLQDLIVAAVSQGLQKSKELREEESKKAMGSLGLPNMPGLGGLM